MFPIPGSGNDLELAGYVQPFSGNTDWWRPSGTMILDDEAFYHPIAHEDPFGNTTTLGYDDHDLFVVEVTDAVGNVVEAAHDYRTLAPWEITDPNGAKQQVAFDALGWVAKMAVIGTATPTPEGDTLEDPTVQFTYEVDRWAESGLPNRVKVEHREVHGAAGFQVHYAYSDGGGQVVMTKVQAKPGLAPERDEHGALVFDDGVLQFAEADPRWIGTGRTVLDNKGNIVKQFEPFFSSTHEYEDDDDLVEWGVTPVMTYDPLGRQVRVDLPDGTFQTVFFDPWRSEAWDGADNVDGSAWHLARESTATPTPSAEDQRAATLSLAHAETPTITHLDALGRAIVTIEDLGDDATVQTTLTLDLAGHVLTVQGEKGRTAATPYVDQAETYDMLGRPMRSASADAGLSWALLAADDRPIRTFREGPICVHAAYDALRRPTALKVQEGAGITATRTHEKLLYGEASGAPTGAGSYHRGRVWKSWDGAGMVEVVAYDFKGHAVEVARQLVALDDVDKTIDWDATPGAGIAALETGETFTTEQRFDALDRVVEAVTPDGSVTLYAYNEAGLLESVDVNVRGSITATAFVEQIDYDEKGRRTEIVYGNGTTTTHAYDPLTFRLTRLKTTRASDSAVLQDLRYFYDAVGNIVEVQDDAQQTEFFANAVVSPTQKYEYDALYRLTNAKGRQKQTMSGIPNHADPSKGGIPDGTAASPGAMSTYERRYSYDGVGNIVEMKQVSAWTRTYTYAADSNRLATTTEAGGTKNYRYNARGAMISMAHLDHASTGFDDPMVSDFRDQLAHVTLNSSGHTARFHYDPTRERVRKVWTKGAIIEERIYLGGWELWRKHVSGMLSDERETLHVIDGESRIAMVETLTVSGGSTVGSPLPVSRFQLGNHLGSASLELDADGELLTYEEFFPYGSTSWWAERSASPVSHKRYRYIGKEKDEETGLHYHSARYLAGWLGRWTSSDPAGLVDGVGTFSYANGGPSARSDTSGLSDAPTTYARMAQGNRSLEWQMEARQLPEDTALQSLYKFGAIASTSFLSGGEGLLRLSANLATDPVGTTRDLASDWATSTPAYRIAVGDLDGAMRVMVQTNATYVIAETFYDSSLLPVQGLNAVSLIVSGEPLPVLSEVSEIGLFPRGTVVPSTLGDAVGATARSTGAAATIGLSVAPAGVVVPTTGTASETASLASARIARDSLAAEYRRKSAVYIGAERDGIIVAGRSGGLLHAEDAAQGALRGGTMTEPVGWRRNPATGLVEMEVIPVCRQCQAKYPPNMFIRGTPGEPGGRWGYRTAPGVYPTATAGWTIREQLLAPPPTGEHRDSPRH